ncbi:hypothetical protein HDU67_005179 [Dinochytrium kinnereticum]|nr:hypothetical protein HDU67_005179 [Dinochytrium kinnereticum]
MHYVHINRLDARLKVTLKKENNRPTYETLGSGVALSNHMLECVFEKMKEFISTTQSKILELTIQLKGASVVDSSTLEGLVIAWRGTIEPKHIERSRRKSI